MRALDFNAEVLTRNKRINDVEPVKHLLLLNVWIDLAQHLDYNFLRLTGIDLALLHQPDVLVGELRKIGQGTGLVCFIEVAESFTQVHNHEAKAIKLVLVTRLGSHPEPEQVKEFIEPQDFGCLSSFLVSLLSIIRRRFKDHIVHWTRPMAQDLDSFAIGELSERFRPALPLMVVELKQLLVIDDLHALMQGWT